MKNFRLFIPTRDSAKWVGIFLNEYRKLGLEPLYIVDARSTDGTQDLLRSMGADIRLFTPRGDVVEAGMLEYGSRAAGSDWVLRLDDDEFPSKALLEWIHNVALRAPCESWLFSRRDLWMESGRLVYSRWPTRMVFHGGILMLNPQQRLYRPASIHWVEKVHTAGFLTPESARYAPPELFFGHFNNVLRSPTERLDKVRRYAQYDKETAWKVIDEYLPELTDKQIHDFACDSLEEFEPLLSLLPVSRANELPELTLEEMKLMHLATQRWLAESARGAQQQVLLYQRFLSSRLYFLPAFVLQRLAEACMTLGRAMKREALYAFGLHVWRLKKLKEDLLGLQLR